MFAVGTERPRATFIPYATREDALSRDRARSASFRLLSGSWRFRWVENPFAVPAGFEQPGFDDSAWDTLPVPSNWQVVAANENRPYDRPFFTNIKHPFEADPPRVPHDKNPTGLYRTRFEVPGEWKGRRVFVHFAGVQSAPFVERHPHTGAAGTAEAIEGGVGGNAVQPPSECWVLPPRRHGVKRLDESILGDVFRLRLSHEPHQVSSE